MSKTVDERVVEMRFDNKQFESNVQTTMGTLEKLKSKLNFKGAEEGFESINNAAKTTDLSPLINGIQGVENAFSASGVFIKKTIENITDDIYSAVKNVINSLTAISQYSIENISAGFAEYEETIDSVQVMLNSLEAPSLETVNKYLDELNVYADKTIYSFADMKASIGKFTNAGVSLKDAVAAIKGISNEAAVSGANAQQASHAMYNFAQALSAGSVKLIDWKSIENANMATVEFKQELIKTAVALGTLVEEGGDYISTTADANGNTSDWFNELTGFNESLSAQWMTTEVLTKTLARYADETTEVGKKANEAAQEVKTFSQMMDTLKEAAGSQWTTTWQTILGDYNEAKSLWTDVSKEMEKVFTSGGVERNRILDTWKQMNGRNLLFANDEDHITGAFWNLFYAITDVANVIKEAFHDIFGELDAEKLYEFTASVYFFAQKLRMSEETMAKVKSAFEGFFAAINIGINIIKSVVTVIVDLFKHINEISGFTSSLLDASGSLGNFFVNLNDSLEKAHTFEDAVKNIETVLFKVADGIHTIIKSLAESIASFARIDTSGLDSFTDKLTARFSLLLSIGGKTAERFGQLGSIFSKILDTLKPIFSSIGQSVDKAIDGILTSFNESLDNFSIDSFLKIIELALSGSLILVIKKFVDYIKSLKDVLGIGELFEGVTGALEGLGDVLSAWQTNLKSDTLMKIAIAIAVLVASLFILTTIEPDKLKEAIKSITMLFTDLISAFAIISKTSGAAKKIGMTAIGAAMIEISVALLILSTAMKSIGSMNMEEIGKSLASMAIALQIMPAALNSINAGGAFAKALSMILLSTSLVVLGKAMQELSSLSWEGIGKALASMAVALYLMPAALNSVEPKGSFRKASSMVLLSASLLILGKAMQELSSLSWEGIGKALASMAVALYLMPAALNSTDPKGSFKNALSMILLSSSLIILGKAMQELSSLSWEGIGKALASMAVALYLMPAALNSTDPKGSFKNALSMILLSSSLIILGKAMQELSSLSWEGIGKALASMAVALFVTFQSINSVTVPPIAKAVSFIIVFESLKTLASVMKEIALLSWEEIGKGLLAMSTALAVVVIAIRTLDGSGAIKNSAGLLIAAVALDAIALSLKLLSTIGWAELLVGLGGLVSVLTVIGVATKVLGPMTGQMLVLAGSMAAFSVSMALFSVSALTFGIALFTIGTGLTAIGASMPVIAIGLSELIPVLIEQLGTLLLGLANAIIETYPTIMESVSVLIVSTCDMLKENIPYVVATVVEMILSICTELRNNIPTIADTLFALIVALMDSMIEYLPEIVSKVFVLVLGLLDGLVEYTPEIVDKLCDVIISIIDGISLKMPDIINSVFNLIGSIFGGIIDGVISSIVSGLPALGSDLSAFSDNISPFLDTMSGISEDSMKGVKLLAETILLLTAAEFIEGLNSFTSIFGGKTSAEKLGDSIVTFGTSISKFAEITSDLDGAKLTTAANAAKVLTEMANALPKEDGLWQDFFGTGDLTKFGEELESFGPHFAAYAKSVSEITNTDAIIASATAAKALADFANNLPPHDGIWQDFVGDSSLAGFAEEMKAFAPALVAYAKTVDGLDTDSVTNSITAASSLRDFATNLPAHDGIWQDWVGDNSLTSFAEELKSFAPALVDYSDTVKDIDTDAVAASASAAGVLAAVESGLDDTGGVVSWFAGDNTLSGFAEGLPVLGTALHDYAVNLGNFDPEIVTASASAAETLGTLQNGLSDTGGVVSWFAGDNTLGGFSEGLPKLGAALHDYSENLGNFNPQKVDESAKALIALADLESGLSNSGGLTALINGDNTLSAFGQGVAELGKGIGSFYNDIRTVSTSKISDVLSQTETLVERIKNASGIFNAAMTEMSTSGISDFLSAFDDSSDAIKETVENLLAAFTDSVNNRNSDFSAVFNTLAALGTGELEKSKEDYTTVGNLLSDNFIQGFELSNDKFSSSIEALLKSSVENIEDKESNFYDAGAFLINGLISGINSNAYKVNEATREMARSAVEAAETELDINSPSRVFYGIGEFAGQGFVNALDDYSKVSYNSGLDMADSAVDGLSSTIQRIADYINSDIDTEPTIRPVLDLSNIDEGANAINGMFTSRRTIELAGRANFDMNTAASRNQNGVVVNNKDVVTAVKDLRGEMSDLVDKFSKLQIVLNTGALVGELASPMDTAIGVRASRSIRGRG